MNHQLKKVLLAGVSLFGLAGKKKYIVRAFLILAFIAANHVFDGGIFDMLQMVGPAAAQVALTQTTLSSAVNGPSVYNGTQTSSNAIDQVVFLASVTGISAPSLPGSPVSVIYVGREAMGVFTVNTNLKSVGVFRGYLGTIASPHPSGDMVLISNVYSTTQAFGANPLPSGFFNVDPPQGGTCTAAGTPTTPWVNVTSGAQWLCSSVTNTWVPGFNNALCSGMGPACVPTASVASASTILPTGPLFHLTGTTSVGTITPPVGCNATGVGGCQVTAICDGICVWSAAGNITTASGTMVAGTAVTFIWNAATSKWIPNVTT